MNGSSKATPPLTVASWTPVVAALGWTQLIIAILRVVTAGFAEQFAKGAMGVSTSLRCQGQGSCTEQPLPPDARYSALLLPQHILLRPGTWQSLQEVAQGVQAALPGPCNITISGQEPAMARGQKPRLLMAHAAQRPGHAMVVFRGQGCWHVHGQQAYIIRN